MNVVDHIHKCFVFVVRLDARVVEVGDGTKVVNLRLAIVVSN